jgi:catechol 2,3-dioxygenase-like lactoylglutathione lyase family enzyme
MYAPALTGVHHLGLTVGDIDRSERWYAEVLGLVRAFVEPHPTGGGHTVVMTCPATALFLGLDHHPRADRAQFDPRRTGLDHLALRVADRADLDMWVDRLDGLGISHEPVHENAEPPFASVLLRDPDGIPIELFWAEH